MKTNKKNLIQRLALTSAAVCALMLAFSPNAKAVTNLTFNDQYRVGSFQFQPGNPADPDSVATYVNYMITLSPGGSGTFSGMPFTRSNNVFANLPTAITAGNVKVDNPPNNNGVVNINLGATVGTYSYLFAKYDGQNDISQVWYVGNLSGQITIPYVGLLGHNISGYTLFAGAGVPDGGTTVMLLGAALGALGMVRRKLKI